MTLKRAKYDPSPGCDAVVNSIENGTHAAVISLSLIRTIVNILSTLVAKCFVVLASFDRLGSPSTMMKGIYFPLIMQMKNCVRFLFLYIFVFIYCN